MNVLIDAHALLWFVDQEERLSPASRLALMESANELWVGTGTVWELAIKVGLGKLVLSLPFREWIERAISDLNAKVLPITIEHADVHSRLPSHHRDPFDRLLVAQAQVEGLSLVSADSVFDEYGIDRIW